MKKKYGFAAIVISIVLTNVLIALAAYNYYTAELKTAHNTIVTLKRTIMQSRGRCISYMQYLERCEAENRDD